MSEIRKVVLLGGGGVGKSALVINFVQGFFLDVYDPTIEDSYRKQVSVDDKVVLIDLLDTAGQEEYMTMRGLYMRDGEGFMFVYSVASRQSFDEAKALFQQTLMYREDDSVPSIFVANKCDLVDDREVSREEGLEFAQRCGSAYIESSALAGINVEESFFQMIREIRTADANWEGNKPLNKKSAKDKKKQCVIF